MGIEFQLDEKCKHGRDRNCDQCWEAELREWSARNKDNEDVQR